jgi:hypothetical protein
MSLISLFEVPSSGRTSHALFATSKHSPSQRRIRKISKYVHAATQILLTSKMPPLGFSNRTRASRQRCPVLRALQTANMLERYVIHLSRHFVPVDEVSVSYLDCIRTERSSGSCEVMPNMWLSYEPQAKERRYRSVRFMLPVPQLPQESVLTIIGRRIQWRFDQSPSLPELPGRSFIGVHHDSEGPVRGHASSGASLCPRLRSSVARHA